MMRNLRIAGGLIYGLFLGSACVGGVSGEEAHRLVKSGALLLDVRTAEEFEAGHISGAVNAPVQDLALLIPNLPAKKDQDVVVYCQSGSRSANAASMLRSAGFTKVHDLGARSNWR